jgi:polar amino acid transport system substrate-binding protein
VFIPRSAVGILGITAALSLALTGCVDNSKKTSSGSPSATTSVSTVTKDDAAAALLPASVKSAGKIVIGVDPTYAPNEFKDSSGKPIGWEIEFMDAVAKKLGVTTEYQPAKFDNIIPGVKGAKYNVGLSSFTDNKEREKSVDFINYFTAGIQWASAKGKTVDPDNACGLKVAVQSTTFEDTDEVPAKSKKCTAAGKPAIQKLKFDTQDDATNAVVLGRADALSADSPVSLYAIKQTGEKLQKAGAEFDAAPYGLAVAKDGGTMKEALQKAIQSMMDDGSYTAILDKWGVTAGAIKTATINGAQS